MSQATRNISGAEGLLLGLKELGVDYIFGNVGTDFPPILGALTRYQQAGRLGVDVPLPIAVPHENVAVNMAYGYYLATGKPQVIFVHTNVGTANALIGLINASRGHVPLIVIAGVAPTTEQFGRTSKPGFIHWAQEMFDQAGMVRENVKWDYHLSPDNVVELDLILQRAWTMAMAYPPGPVYLTFAAEAMEQAITLPATIVPPVTVSVPYPDPVVMGQVAGWLAGAKRPLIISGGTDRNHAILPALQAVAESHAIGVTGLVPRNLHFPMNHPLYLGDNPHAAVKEADLIISLETDVPYMPIHGRPPAGCRVVHVGPDPVFQRYPRYGFQSDAYVNAGLFPFLQVLLAMADPPAAAMLQGRRGWVGGMVAEKTAVRQREIAKAQMQGEMNFGWVSHCVAEAVAAHPELIVLREFDLQGDYLPMSQPGSFYGLPNAGGLGWGQGVALGLRLADPSRIPLLATGDGCYYFSAPLSAHSLASSQQLPFITLVFNNGEWQTVTNYVNRWYPGLEEPVPPLTSLGPPPDFEKVVGVFGGHGERVARPEELPGALARGIEAVKNGRQVLINVLCPRLK
ncbi:MAG: thiamine pyrophosphate-requiring protein [Chloroflexota bacterium]